MNPPRPVLRDTAIWGLTGAGVLSAHILGVTWLMTRADAAGTPMPSQEAVFIELAAAPTPAETPVEDTVEEEAVEEVEPEPEPEPEPLPEPELPELEPLPDLPDLSSIVPEAAATLNVSKRPERRPERPEPEPERVEKREKPVERTEKPRERRAEQQPQRQASAQQAGGRPSREGAGGTNRATAASWQQKVGSRISRHMQRAKTGHRQALLIQIRVSIAADGSARGQLVGSTGDAGVDAKLQARAASLPRMDPPPPGAATSFTLPIQLKR